MHPIAALSMSEQYKVLHMGDSFHARETFPGPDVGLDFLTRFGISKTSPYFKRYRGHVSLHGPWAPICYWCLGFGFLFLFWWGLGGSTGARTWGLMHERQVIYHWTTPTLSSTPQCNQWVNQPRKQNTPHLPRRVCCPRSILKCLQSCSPEGIGDFYCSFLREKKMHTRFRSQCITHS